MILLDIDRLFISLILGLVEGVTEFFPISSTGHMILFEKMLGFSEDDYNKVIMISIQLGSVLSIMIMFWHRLRNIGLICLGNFFTKNHYKNNSHLCIYHILIGTIPGIVLGIFLFRKIRLIFDLVYVVYGLILGGFFLLISEWRMNKVPLHTFNIHNITYLQAFLIGCFQCLAFCPGFSRSGSTIGGGLLVGLHRNVALEFSFILAIPIMLGSIVAILYSCNSILNFTDIILLLMGWIVAFLITFIFIKFFFKIIKKISLIPFIIYRFVLAGGIYWNFIFLS